MTLEVTEKPRVTKKTKTSLFFVCGILTLIPFAVLLIVPSYAKTAPTLVGLPFFYWYQILWLFLAALLFGLAAFLYNRYGGE